MKERECMKQKIQPLFQSHLPRGMEDDGFNIDGESQAERSQEEWQLWSS